MSDTMREHELKTDATVFQAVLDGFKTYEIRLNDRGFLPGDALFLLETRYTGAEMKNGAPLEYTGRQIIKIVSHVLQGQYGLKDGWCILSFTPAASAEAGAGMTSHGDEAIAFVREMVAMKGSPQAVADYCRGEAKNLVTMWNAETFMPSPKVGMTDEAVEKVRAAVKHGLGCDGNYYKDQALDEILALLPAKQQGVQS